MNLRQYLQQVSNKGETVPETVDVHNRYRGNMDDAYGGGFAHGTVMGEACLAEFILALIDNDKLEKLQMPEGYEG